MLRSGLEQLGACTRKSPGGVLGIQSLSLNGIVITIMNILPEMQRDPGPLCFSPDVHPSVPPAFQLHLFLSHSVLSGSVLYFNFFIFCFFRAAPMAYGSSQARGRIGAVAAGLHHSHNNAGSTSATYTTAHGKAGSFTH